MKNLITDIEGILVGCAEDHRFSTGVTVLSGPSPFTAAVDVSNRLRLHGLMPAQAICLSRLEEYFPPSWLSFPLCRVRLPHLFVLHYSYLSIR